MTKIYLIRHGESIGNATRKYLGHTDLDLSPLGYSQAAATAERLVDIPFTAIYSSDLIRARNTAEPHAKLRGLRVKTVEELREMHVGEWEGMPIDELLKLDSFINGWKKDFGNFTIPGGECVATAADRIYDAIRRIAENHDGETVAVVFHAGAMRAFWCKMLGLPKDEWALAVKFPTNASYSVIEYEDGKFVGKEYSQDEHLRKVGVSF